MEYYRKLLLTKNNIILFIILFALLYNFLKYSLNTNNFIILIIIIYFIYQYKDIIKDNFNITVSPADKDIFFDSIIKNNNINPNLKNILYNARFLYPFDKKNYKNTLKYANETSILKNKIDNCNKNVLYRKQLYDNLKDFCKNTLNSFNSILYSLPALDPIHHKTIKSLQKELNNYINLYNTKIDKNQNLKGVNKTFNFYLI